MADYQRFVSYLYEYKNNVKSQNCGFCRVELREHTCRLELHLKLQNIPFTPTLHVYTFVPDNGKLYGIFLGNASGQHGNITGTFSFSDRNIQNSIYHFTDLGGVFLTTDTGQCFASAWKDLTIQPEVFTVDCPKTASLPNPAAEASIIEPEPLPDEASMPAPSASLPEESSSPESSEEAEKAEPALMAASRDLSAQKENVWEEILSTYPQCHPFFDDEIHNCTQLSPKDFQKFDILGILLNNNVFFHHNCQSFQHFLIGKKDAADDASGDLYILAVPGLYNPREHYMASAFGFPYFKPAQHTRFTNNAWGYWYRIIPEHCCE